MLNGKKVDPGDKSGDLYDSGMGDVTGGSVDFDKDGSGQDHHSVHGDGGHFSWDTNSDGDVSGNHGTIHDSGGNTPW